MKSMALTAEERKSEDYGPCCVGEDADDKGPKYPYGLEICLRSESLKKLGLGLMPVGTEVIIMARAKVVGTGSRETENGGKREDMDIQITNLDINPAQADRIAASAAKLYPDSD